MNIASVVPLPGLNPNWISSSWTSYSLFNNSFHHLHYTWFRSFIPLYEPHSRASPFPLYTLTIQLRSQSCGTLPSCSMALQISVTHLIPTSPLSNRLQHFGCNPDEPAALYFFICSIATFTSCSVINSPDSVVELSSSCQSLRNINESNYIVCFIIVIIIIIILMSIFFQD